MSFSGVCLPGELSVMSSSRRFRSVIWSNFQTLRGPLFTPTPLTWTELYVDAFE